MNIKITDNWLKKFVQTDATANKIGECISLTGPSVESVIPVKIGGKEDFIYDIEITTNRVDMASVVGIARETVASLESFEIPAKLILPDFSQVNFTNQQLDKIEISDKSQVVAYNALVVENVHVMPSSVFVSDRLKAIGINSINNLVDISNIMMIEWGIPMHFFDLDKISPKMKFRTSLPGEKIRLLDEKELTLKGGEIVAEVNGKLVDLCGVMGGLDSKVDENTKNILVWIPIYDKMAIRSASLSHQIRTPAAVLYEKDLDIHALSNVTKVTLHEIQMVSPNCRLVNAFQNIQSIYQPKSIRLDRHQIKKFLGCEIAESRIIRIFDQLGFITDSHADHFLISVPAWRGVDVTNSVDLLEELARIYGYHRLPTYLSANILPPLDSNSENLREIKDVTANLLADLGLFEIITYSLVSKNLLMQFDQDFKSFMKVTQSVSDDFIFLRQSLLPQMINTFKQNYYKNPPLGFFEIGKVYLPQAGDLPIEDTHLVVSSQNLDNLKSILSAFFTKIQRVFSFLPTKDLELYSSCSDIWVKNQIIGKIGKIKSKYFLKEKSLGDLYIFDINIDKLSESQTQSNSIQLTSQYAKIKRDLTLIHDSHHTFDFWKQKFYSLVIDFDIKVKYLSKFENNITIQLEFSSKTRDLTEKEVNDFLKEITTNPES